MLHGHVALALEVNCFEGFGPATQGRGFSGLSLASDQEGFLMIFESAWYHCSL